MCLVRRQRIAGLCSWMEFEEPQGLSTHFGRGVSHRSPAFHHDAEAFPAPLGMILSNVTKA